VAARFGKAMCSKCGSYDTLPSRKQSAILDSFMGMFGKRPYRCHACRGRFYAKEPEIEAEIRDDGHAAAHEPDQLKGAAAPHPAARSEPSRPGDEYLQDLPTRSAEEQGQAGPIEDPVKGEEPRGTVIPAGGAGESSGATAVQPSPGAGDAEKRRAAPGLPEELEDEDAGEVPSVQELLSRVDRIIESTRAQKGPDAQVAARPGGGGGAPREALLRRLARALRLSPRRPARP